MPVTDVHHDLDARTLTITAEFAAPVERVWEVYADPRQLERVWGPPAYPATFVDHDLAPGGRMNYFMTSPEGEKYYAYWDIADRRRAARLLLQGRLRRRRDLHANPEMPESTQVYAFADDDGGTRATFVATYADAESLQKVLDMGAVEGSTLGHQPDRRPARFLTRTRSREDPRHAHPRRHRRSSPSTASSRPPAAATTRTPAGRSRTSSSTRRPTRSRAARPGEATALLFGRQSYDEFAPVWPSMEEFATYNAMPKYVVSTTLAATPRQWSEAPTVLRSPRRRRRAQGDRGRGDPRPRQRHAWPRASPPPAWSTATTCSSSRSLLGSGKRLFGEGDKTKLPAHRARRLRQRDHAAALRRRALRRPLAGHGRRPARPRSVERQESPGGTRPAARLHGRRRARRHRRQRAAARPGAAPAGRRRRRGGVRPRRPDHPPRVGGRAARAAAAAALRGGDPDLAGRLQRQPRHDPAALGAARPRHDVRGRPRSSTGWCRAWAGAASIAIGAVVAPPDAVAATAVARRIGLPRRVVTILEGESLLNDATALVTLRTAIAALSGGVGHHRGRRSTSSVAAGGGVLIGVAVLPPRRLAAQADHRPADGHRDLLPDAVRGVRGRRGDPRLRRHLGRRRRPAARPQGADHPDRAVAHHRADHLAHRRLRAGEHRSSCSSASSSTGSCTTSTSRRSRTGRIAARLPRDAG